MRNSVPRYRSPQIPSTREPSKTSLGRRQHYRTEIAAKTSRTSARKHHARNRRCSHRSMRSSPTPSILVRAAVEISGAQFEVVNTTEHFLNSEGHNLHPSSSPPLLPRCGLNAEQYGRNIQRLILGVRSFVERITRGNIPYQRIAGSCRSPVGTASRTRT